MPQPAELSEQQKKCLRLVHQGLTSKEIAPLLETTPGVVDNYITVAMAKLGTTSRRDAARMLAARENDMVQQLHLQPGAIAPRGPDDPIRPRIEGRPARLLRSLGLPPIGGQTNDLSKSQRLSAIARIALFSAIMLMATVAIVQGIIVLLA